MSFEEYISLFKEEAEEHLQMMNQNLLVLEKEPANKPVINEIFRNAHTLKGMAASMNFSKITELSHEMENLMDLLRSGKLTAEAKIIDTLFSCFDALELLVEEAVTGVKKEVDLAPLVAALKVYTAAKQEPVKEAVAKQAVAIKPVTLLTDAEKEAGRKALSGGYFFYYIKVTLDEGCLLKAARAYMVFRNLDEMGKAVKYIPTRPEIEEEKFDFSFEVFLSSGEKSEEIQKTISNISEIKKVEVIPFAPEELTAAFSEKAQEKVKEGLVLPVKNEEEPKEAKETKTDESQIVHTVRVDIKRLDSLMNLVGELVISRTQLVQMADTKTKKEFGDTLAQVGRVVADLQDLVMKVRMVPIEQVFNRFPRMVRDLAKSLHKQINLEISGEDTEIDRTVIDEIGDPLVHLLRNSVDHGVESPEDRKKAGKPEIGTVKLSASHEGDRIVIKVEDDGAGINPEIIANKAADKGIINKAELTRMSEAEKMNLIFLPGVTTASKISDVSGRGVGMDVVRSKIMALRGLVEVRSQIGQGTSIIIKLPLTLAIIEALMICLKEEIYAIPLEVIDETVMITPEDITLVKDCEVILLRGDVLPLIRLRRIYDIMEETVAAENQRLAVVVVHQANKRVGLVVDALIGQQEIVIKSLGSLLNNIHGIAGATIMGDGRVALIIDIAALH